MKISGLWPKNFTQTCLLPAAGSMASDEGLVAQAAPSTPAVSVLEPAADADAHGGAAEQSRFMLLSSCESIFQTFSGPAQYLQANLKEPCDVVDFRNWLPRSRGYFVLCWREVAQGACSKPGLCLPATSVHPCLSSGLYWRLHIEATPRRWVLQMLAGRDSYGWLPVCQWSSLGFAARTRLCSFGLLQRPSFSRTAAAETESTANP